MYPHPFPFVQNHATVTAFVRAMNQRCASHTRAANRAWRRNDYDTCKSHRDEADSYAEEAAYAHNVWMHTV